MGDQGPAAAAIGVDRRRSATLDRARRTPSGRGDCEGVASPASKDAAVAAEVRGWLVVDGHEALLAQDTSDGILAVDDLQRTGCSRHPDPRRSLPVPERRGL